MPKIGPNKVYIDPKVYAARVTSAKKRVAQIDPATKAKIKDMYPKVTKAEAAKQALGVKKTTPEQKRMQSNMSKKTPTKMPAVKRPAIKPAQMPTKPKPAIGADKSARKKFGPSSHNNGYTN
jgi:hypothetical protein